MSYSYTVLGDAPVALYSMDVQSGGFFTDSSGYGNNATVVGGMTTQTTPIVALGLGSQYLTGTGMTIPNTSLMIANLQSRPFSFEMWYKHQTNSGTGTFFKRTTSGLSITGNTITFTLAMSATNTLSYSGLLVGEVYHVVATYDGTYAALWLNDVCVATLIIDDTNYNAGFTDVATTLSFAAASGFTCVLDSVAVYNYSLHKETIDSHYTTGISYPDVMTMSTYNGSHQYPISDAHVTILTQALANSDATWALGTISGAMMARENILQNSWSDLAGQYASGTWLYNINIEPQAITLAGSRLTWDSNKTNTDIKVEISTDAGTTWTQFTNGSAPIGALNIASGASVSIRVTFAAGSTQTILRRLKLVIYQDKTVVGTNSATSLAVSDPVNATLAEYDYAPASFSDNLGINLPGPTTKLTLPADSSLGGYQAFEFLIKFTSSTASKTVMASNAATPPGITTDVSGNWVCANIVALYVDGVSRSLTSFLPTSNVWHHVVVVFASKQNDFYFANNLAGSSAYPCRIGYFAAYYSQPSSTQIAAVYNYWAGVAPTRVTEANIVTITDYNLSGGLPCRGYSLNWSVSGAG